jgi:hypothetical protein
MLQPGAKFGPLAVGLLAFDGNPDIDSSAVWLNETIVATMDGSQGP